MSSPAHILSAPESSPDRVLRYAGRWIGWTGISVMLTFVCYYFAGAYLLDPVRGDRQEVSASFHTPSPWQLDELAVLER